MPNAAITIPITFLLTLATPAPAEGTECDIGSACIPDEDLRDMVEALREKQCLLENEPHLDIGAVELITDKDGRVYYSGAAPVPLRARLVWCSYEVEFSGDVKVVVAREVPPEWGWRYRLKFAGSYLPLDAIEREPQDGVDVGLLWEFLYWRDLNLNLATGFRSAGLSVGYDLTNNFGAFGGYAFSFWTMRSNPQAGLYFSFW